jgi:hypothetical protein
VVQRVDTRPTLPCQIRGVKKETCLSFFRLSYCILSFHVGATAYLDTRQYCRAVLCRLHRVVFREGAVGSETTPDVVESKSSAISTSPTRALERPVVELALALLCLPAPWVGSCRRP